MQSKVRSKRANRKRQSNLFVSRLQTRQRFSCSYAHDCARRSQGCINIYARHESLFSKFIWPRFVCGRAYKQATLVFCLEREIWAVLFFVTHLLKGALLFATLILIATGYTIFKSYLTSRERNLLMFVLPLQVCFPFVFSCCSLSNALRVHMLFLGLRQYSSLHSR